MARGAIVVAGASCNPAHSGHLQAIDYAINLLRHRGHHVQAAYIAVSPDGYCKEKYGHMTIPGEHRLAMVNMLAKEHRVLRPVPRCFGSPIACGEAMLNEPREGLDKDTIIVVVSGSDRADRVEDARFRNKDPNRQWIICPQSRAGALGATDTNSAKIRDALQSPADDWNSACDAAQRVGLPQSVASYMRRQGDLAALFGHYRGNQFGNQYGRGETGGCGGEYRRGQSGHRCGGYRDRNDNYHSDLCTGPAYNDRNDRIGYDRNRFDRTGGAAYHSPRR